MKSGKQKRAELQAKRAIKRAAEEEARQKERERRARQEGLDRGVAVDTNQLAPDNSYGDPDFVMRGYYVDKPFTCQECGVPQNWTAAQQKWWYEVAKGSVWTTARLCRPCRQTEHARREAARRVQLDGLARKLRRSAPDQDVDVEPE